MDEFTYCIIKKIFLCTAAGKLGLDNVDLKLFLADDWFEIDEDIILDSDIAKGKILVIAKEKPTLNNNTKNGMCIYTFLYSACFLRT